MGRNVCIFDNNICPTISASGVSLSIITLDRSRHFETGTFLIRRHYRLSPLSHAQLTWVSETGFDSVRFHMHIIRLFENDVIWKKKMVAEVVVSLRLALVWLWSRHTAKCSESEG